MGIAARKPTSKCKWESEEEEEERRKKACGGGGVGVYMLDRTGWGVWARLGGCKGGREHCFCLNSGHRTALLSPRFNRWKEGTQASKKVVTRRTGGEGVGVGGTPVLLSVHSSVCQLTVQTARKKQTNKKVKTK